MPPKPGLAVDVKLDRAGQILAITGVSESQLANEQAERSMDKVEAAWLQIFRKIVAKCGMRDLRLHVRFHERERETEPSQTGLRWRGESHVEYPPSRETTVTAPRLYSP